MNYVTDTSFKILSYIFMHCYLSLLELIVLQKNNYSLFPSSFDENLIIQVYVQVIHCFLRHAY